MQASQARIVSDVVVPAEAGPPWSPMRFAKKRLDDLQLAGIGAPSSVGNYIRVLFAIAIC